MRTIVAAAVLAADPPKALDDADQAAARAGVFVDPEAKDGYQNIIIKARAGDVQAFNKAIEVIARALKILGHPGPTSSVVPRRSGSSPTRRPPWTSSPKPSTSGRPSGRPPPPAEPATPTWRTRSKRRCPR